MGSGSVERGGGCGLEQAIRAVPLRIVCWMAEEISAETMSICCLLMSVLEFTDWDKKDCKDSILDFTAERLDSGIMGSGYCIGCSGRYCRESARFDIVKIKTQQRLRRPFGSGFV